MRARLVRASVLAAMVVAMLAFASPAWAADFVVNRGGDTSDASLGDNQCDAFPQETGSQCTLRAAVEEVNQRAFNIRPTPSDRITFNLPANTSSINLNQGQLQIGGTNGFIFGVNVEIDGPGADKLRIAGPGSESRVLTVSTRANATIEGLTITNGRLFGASTGETGAGILNAGTLTLRESVVTGNSGLGSGGGIYNSNALTVVRTTISDNNGSGGGGGIFNLRGALTVRNSTLSGNSARSGGGIDAYGDGNGGGTVTIENSTISGNSGSTTSGGGILNESSNVSVKNSTITNNRAPVGQGGGIASRKNGTVSPAPSTEVSSSIVSANRDANTGGAGTDVDDTGGGDFTSGGYNLIGTGNATGSFDQIGDQTGVTDPKLGPLADNDGPTRTHLPASDSPAIDKGKDFTTLSTDQRGALRPQDDPNVANATGGDGSEIGSVEVETLPPPDLSIADTSVTEGTGGANFTLTLSRPTAKTVTVNYSTADGTATAPGDYTGTANGGFTIDAGETQKTLTVPVTTDALDEPDEETFSVTLSGAQNATLTDAQATGAIVDDDSPPEVGVVDVTVTEGDSGSTDAVFDVRLSSPSNREISVDYASSDGTATSSSDYAPKSGTLTFIPGTTRQTITVPVDADTLDEANEDFFVTLTNPTNATVSRDRATGTITDDDSTPQATDDGSANSPIALEEDDPDGVETDVLANDTGLGDAPITVEVTTPPGKGTATVNDDDTITYKPDQDAEGEDAYGYTLTDSDGQTTSATVHLRITPQNDSPTIDLSPADANTVDDSTTFTEGGGPVSVNAGNDLTVTDVDNTDMVGATVRISNPRDGASERLSASAPSGITFNYAASTGVLSFSGTASKADYQQALRTVRYNNTSQNPDTTDRRIEFIVNDGTLDSNTATNAITVKSVNDAPTASNDAYTTKEDKKLRVPAPGVLANDGDPEGKHLSAALVSRPRNGSLTLNANGALSYTPKKDFNGKVSFTYTARDADRARSNASTVTITVRAAAEPAGSQPRQRLYQEGHRRQRRAAWHEQA